MQDLIRIENKDDKNLVDARELHQFLESKQQFINWIQNRIEKYDFVDGEDFIINLLKTPEGGRPIKEYYLTVNCAKEIAMVEGNEKGKEARQYFLECEKKLKSQERQLTTGEYLVLQAQKLLEIERHNEQIKKELNEVRNLAIEANSYNSSNTGFMTIRGFCNIHKIKLSLRESQERGRLASKLAEQYELITGKAKDEIFGEVKSYPVELLEEIFKSK